MFSTNRLATSILTFLLASTSFALASQKEATTKVKGKVSIPPHFQVEKEKEILANTKLVLSNHVETRVAFPNPKGGFSFNGVMAGATYVLELNHPSLFFEPITLETQQAGDQEVKVVPFLNDPMYGKGARLRYPFSLAPSAFKLYFDHKEEFSILSVLKSPMVMIMLFMVGMMYVLPKPGDLDTGDERPRSVESKSPKKQVKQQ